MALDAALHSRKVLIAFGICAAGILILLLVYQLANLFLLAFGAVLLAAFWMGLARWVGSKTGWAYGVTLTLVILFCFAVLGGIFWYLGPTVSKQIDQLLQQIPTSLSALEDRFSQYAWSEELFRMMPEGDQWIQNPEKFVSQMMGYVGTALGVVMNTLLVIAIAVFITVDPKLYHGGALLLFPESKRERVGHALSAASYTLFMWLVGRLVDMIVLGIVTGIGLWFLGFELAVALGVLTAILSFIPNIGPVLSVIPPVLLALADPKISPVSVIVLYIVIQALESYLLTPLIQKKAVQMPPALLLTAQVGMAVLLGGLGLLLATPLVAVALVLVKMLYVEDVLGTPHPPRGELRTEE